MQEEPRLNVEVAFPFLGPLFPKDLLTHPTRADGVPKGLGRS